MYEEEILSKLLDRIEQLSMDKGRLRSELSQAEEAFEEKERKARMVALPEVMALMVVCLSDPQNKIVQIKALREITGLNLKDAKDAVMTAWTQSGKSWDGEVCHSKSYTCPQCGAPMIMIQNDIDGLK